MKWYVFQDPGGQDWYVQAANPEAALAIAKRNLIGRGYGATDIQATQINGEVPNFDPRDPAVGGRVYYATGADTGSGTEATGATGATGNKYIGTDTELGRLGAFQRALQTRGVQQGGFAGEYYDDQYDPYKQAFLAQTHMGNFGGFGGGPDDPAANEQGFQNYVQGTQNPYGDIGAAYRTYAAMRPGQDFGTAEDPQGLADPRRAYVTPGAGNIDQASSFFQSALRGRLGGFAGSALSPYARRASQMYAAQPVDQSAQTNFMDYLRKTIGLGGVQF